MGVLEAEYPYPYAYGYPAGAKSGYPYPKIINAYAYSSTVGDSQQPNSEFKKYNLIISSVSFEVKNQVIYI